MFFGETVNRNLSIVTSVVTLLGVFACIITQVNSCQNKVDKIDAFDPQIKEIREQVKAVDGKYENEVRDLERQCAKEHENLLATYLQLEAAKVRVTSTAESKAH